MDAVRKSVEMLAAETGNGNALVAAGDLWSRDRLVVSVNRGSVQFVTGNMLCTESEAEFLVEVPDGDTAPVRVSGLQGISRYEMPFCMGMASELYPVWPDVASARALLDRFGLFHRNHRTRIDRAELELRYVAEGLVALQHWPAVLTAVMDSMGASVKRLLPRSLSTPDLGAFAGKLLIDTRYGNISLAGVSECLRTLSEPPAPLLEACLRVPHYRRMLDKLERHSEAAAPLMEQLSAAL